MLSTKYQVSSTKYWVWSTQHWLLSTKYWVLRTEYLILSTTDGAIQKQATTEWGRRESACWFCLRVCLPVSSCLVLWSSLCGWLVCNNNGWFSKSKQILLSKGTQWHTKQVREQNTLSCKFCEEMRKCSMRLNEGSTWIMTPRHRTQPNIASK